MTIGPPQPPEDEHRLASRTPSYEHPKTKVNWPLVAVIAAIVVGLAFISVVLAVVAGLVILLLLTVGLAGPHGWIPGSIGDDTKAAIPKRRRGPRDY